MKSSKSGHKSGPGHKSGHKSGHKQSAHSSTKSANESVAARVMSAHPALKVTAVLLLAAIAAGGLGYGLFMFGMLPSWVPGVSLASASASSLPSSPVGPELGKTIVTTSCVGRCHGDKIVSYRASAAGAKRIAQAMAGRCGLTPGQTESVAMYLTR